MDVAQFTSLVDCGRVWPVSAGGVGAAVVTPTGPEFTSSPGGVVKALGLSRDAVHDIFNVGYFTNSGDLRAQNINSISVDSIHSTGLHGNGGVTGAINASGGIGAAGATGSNGAPPKGGATGGAGGTGDGCTKFAADNTPFSSSLLSTCENTRNHDEFMGALWKPVLAGGADDGLFKKLQTN